MIYLDNSATTRQYDEVTELIAETSRTSFANASSLHNLGFNAGSVIFDARREIEDRFAPGGAVVFTSGGTEADNMAILGTAFKLRRRGKRIITTKVEHPAVLETVKRLERDGFEIVLLDVDVDGFLEPQVLKAALTDDTILVSVMSVNNEVGTIEPVTECQRIVDEYNRAKGTKIIFHTDAVQAYGKLPMDDAAFDLVSVSGHKFHGPKGAGFLYMKNGINLPPLITGGGHEMGYRSGTENTPGIAGLGLASRMSYERLDEKLDAMTEVNEYLRRGLENELDDIILNGPSEIGRSLLDAGKRCPSVLNMSFLGTRGEVLLHTLEMDGIYVSTGSACSSHKKNADSHVLQAMSMDHKEIEGAIRFSFSEFNTIDEMDFVIDKVKSAVTRFRRLGSFR